MRHEWLHTCGAATRGALLEDDRSFCETRAVLLRLARARFSESGPLPTKAGTMCWYRLPVRRAGTTVGSGNVSIVGAAPLSSAPKLLNRLGPASGAQSGGDRGTPGECMCMDRVLELDASNGIGSGHDIAQDAEAKSRRHLVRVQEASKIRPQL